MRLSIVSFTKAGAGLAQRIAAERQARDLALGQVALEALFVGDIRGDFVGLVVGVARIGHRQSPGGGLTGQLMRRGNRSEIAGVASR